MDTEPRNNWLADGGDADLGQVLAIRIKLIVIQWVCFQSQEDSLSKCTVHCSKRTELCGKVDNLYSSLRYWKLTGCLINSNLGKPDIIYE